MHQNRSSSARTIALLAAALLTTAMIGMLGGCGSSSASDGAAATTKPKLTVAAASSLKNAFVAYAKQFTAATPRFSFAGSDQLAAQIQQGVKPDVFASANTKLPDQLYAKGLVERPVTFAGNRLVIAVPGGSKVQSLADLATPGVTIAAGSASVPVGAYTRKVLAALPASERNAILANVRSNEPDVAGVVGKLTEGAVDAGFVYVTDVDAAGSKVKAIELPANLNPKVAYGAAVVKGTQKEAAAQAFIAGLVNGKGAEALHAAGFAPAPQ